MFAFYAFKFLVFQFYFIEFTLYRGGMDRYNLHSTRTQEICLSVELQMAGDGEFLSQTLGNSHPDPGQVTFQSNSTSASDLNLSAIFKNSDSHSSPIAKIPESGKFD